MLSGIKHAAGNYFLIDEFSRHTGTNLAVYRERPGFGLVSYIFLLLTKTIAMNKPLRFLALSAVILIAFMSGCSKSSSSGNNNNNQTSNMTYLTQAAWVYDTAGVGSDNSGNIVLSLPAGTIKDCQKEDTLYFYSDGTGSENSGPLKCDTTAANKVPFTWSFNAGQNMITSSDSLFSGFGGAITITALNATQLHLLKTVTVSNVPVIVDLYLKHP